MPCYAAGKKTPVVDGSAAVDESAVLVGAVNIAASVRVGPGALLRGETFPVTIGPGSVIDASAVLVATAVEELRLGNGCHVGAGALLERCRVEDEVTVEPHAVLHAGSIIRRGLTIPAGAVVDPGEDVCAPLTP